MKTIPIYKKEDGSTQYLTEVLPIIPTDTILCKTLTGLGATYCELKAPRHSIIIEPNKPVIAGKVTDPKHAEDNILGVHEGVTVDMVGSYLNATLAEDKLIKIMTTPESFCKVQEALIDSNIEITTDCFLLYDECHKIVEDVDYRANITLPMDLFFRCENKALVSATPLHFSDKRFSEFERIVIEPQFESRKDLVLHVSNNVLQTAKEVFEELGEEKPVFIFCNSTDNILALMQQIGVIEDSAVFCSQKSVEKLRSEEFSNAYDLWSTARMKRFNWLTSRFYNALDIELDNLPNIVLFTDSYFTEYTCFDPHSDVVQCIGRFRNGVSEIHHITNFNSKLRVATRQDVTDYVESSRRIYKTIERFRLNASTSAMKEALCDVQKCLPYSKWLNTDMSTNSFAIDNYIEDEVVKSYYNNSDLLIETYTKSRHFNLRVDNREYKVGDLERLRRYNKALTIKEKRRIIVSQLESIGELDTELDFSLYSDIHAAEPFIVDAYYLIGKNEIERLGYNYKKIKEAMIVAKYREKAAGTEMMNLVKNSFREGTWYEAKFIKTELTRLFGLLGITPQRAITSHTITDFFEAEEQRKKYSRGYYLMKCRTA